MKQRRYRRDGRGCMRCNDRSAGVFIYFHSELGGRCINRLSDRGQTDGAAMQGTAGKLGHLNTELK